MYMYMYMYIVTPINIEKRFILILQQDPTNFCYIYTCICIYIDTHIHHQGLTDTRKAAAWKLQRTPGASVSARREWMGT